MTHPATAHPAAPHEASPRLPQPPARRLLNRLLAALVMGLILVVLSGLVHTAAAASLGGGWSYLWATWLVAALAAIVIALGAPTSRLAWGRLCLVDAAAACLVFVVSLLASPAAQGVATETTEPSPWLGFAHPLGAAFGAALLSGMLGLAAAVLAAALFVVSYFLHHRHA